MDFHLTRDRAWQQKQPPLRRHQCPWLLQGQHHMHLTQESNIDTSEMLGNHATTCHSKHTGYRQYDVPPKNPPKTLDGAASLADSNAPAAVSLTALAAPFTPAGAAASTSGIPCSPLLSALLGATSLMPVDIHAAVRRGRLVIHSLS